MLILNKLVIINVINVKLIAVKLLSHYSDVGPKMVCHM